MNDPRQKLRPRGLLGISGTQHRTFQRNSFLFYAECAADTGYLIRSGHVRCFLLDAEGRETTTALLGPGQFVGTAVLLDLPMHREFCEALTGVEAWSLPADELRRGCSSSALVQGWLLGSIGRRLELALALRRGISLLSARDRAADIQLRMHGLSGVEPGTVRQASLANLLQIRPETLARAHTPRERRPVEQARRQIPDGYVPEGCIGQVVSGDVELSLTAGESRAITVETLKAGDLFGFSSLLALPALALRLVGAAPGAISVIPQDEFLRHLALRPTASGEIVIRLADRLQSVEQQLVRAALPDVGTRLSRVLREAAVHDGAQCVPSSLSHGVLARRLGVRRETVTRGLATLVKTGVIRRQGRRIMMVSEELQGVTNKCQLCGLRTPGALCVGCAERLERDLERDQDRACPNCGRHRELCQAMPCTSLSPAETRRANTPTIVWVPTAKIDEPCAARNSRRKYVERSIQELAISLRQEGFLQPICVRRKGPRFELVFGVRRFRAAMHAGLSEVPCTVRDADDDRALLLNALENLHREQLSNLERVHTIERLGGSGLGVREISRRTGFNASTISRWLRINRRPELKKALEENRLDVARAVILVDAPDAIVGSLIDGAMAVSTAELRRQVFAMKAGAKAALQKDRRHLTDALKCLRAVRSNISEPLLVETLQMELDRISGNATIAGAQRDLNGTTGRTSTAACDSPHKLLTQVPSG